MKEEEEGLVQSKWGTRSEGAEVATVVDRAEVAREKYRVTEEYIED